MVVASSPPRVACLPVADIELPSEVGRLYDLAYNLWWTWNPAARDLFRTIDPAAWDHYRNPVELLINVEPTHWRQLLADGSFVDEYRRVIAELDAYLAAPGQGTTWFADRYPGYDDGPIAYFSMEYGLHQSLAIYSGGLGVLSGDHAKAASDLGLPFVAVGLLYRHGYFRQTLDAEGRQQHVYPDYDFTRLPLRPVAAADGGEIRLTVPLPGREVAVRLWMAEVGRVPVLLLDTDVDENDPADRPITNTLYVRGREMRLVQEVLVGVGGVRALAALGIEPAVWHINEGHSALLQLERLRRRVAAGIAPADARREIAADAVFTTHTPVPAGNEQFDRTLAKKYLDPLASGLGFSIDEVLAWGDAGDGGGTFNLTALALGTTRWANAVSRKNAEVANAMWSRLLGGEKSAETVIERPLGPRGHGPIKPLTNGVHAGTWIGREVRALLAEHLGADWRRRLLEPAAWERLLDLPDEALWQAHRAQKQRLAEFARHRWREQFARHGCSPDELREVARLFDVDALTIGFARRFATYKRARLVFRDRERFEELVTDRERPLQILFAGKAHPADRPGQELIQEIFELSRSAGLRGRIFFLEDYDMLIGRRLVQGVDLWLNTPRKPFEASGTSGQKAAMNGVLNFSVLDGWWLEGYDGANGWVVGDETEPVESEEKQDDADAAALYEVLAGEIIPAYYDRDPDGLPRRWLARMKRSLVTTTPRFSASRMVRDYTERAYLSS